MDIISLPIVDQRKLDAPSAARHLEVKVDIVIHVPILAALLSEIVFGNTREIGLEYGQFRNACIILSISKQDYKSDAILKLTVVQVQGCAFVGLVFTDVHIHRND